MTSFGTEGRRNGDDEIPASDNIYEYIVFRGSDVKDLRIEDPPKETKPAPPPPMPNDPAILGVRHTHHFFQFPLDDEAFGCKLLVYHRERKTVWIFPLPSF